MENENQSMKFGGKAGKKNKNCVHNYCVKVDNKEERMIKNTNHILSEQLIHN